MLIGVLEKKIPNAVPQWDADSNCYVKANLSSSEVVARSLGLAW